MHKNKNRTFYFIETVDSSGNDVIKVGSDFAPVWGNSYPNIADALEAIKRRNKSATRIDDVKNGVIVVYEASQDGDNL
jgi:hypothetical protein